MSNCKLQALYFATVKAEILDEFEGEKGVFIKSFLINTKTNLNDWEVTKEANIKDGPNFKGMPGIEFFNKGRRDHTVGKTYEDALRLQSPHAKGIIRKVIDKTGGEKLEQITRMFDNKMIEKIRKAQSEGKEIFVSPAIFPRSIDDVDIIDMPDGSHIHRVKRYLPLHYAFVDEPAYGDEARITDVCEGDNCLIKLAKTATEGIGQDGLEPIRTIPFVRISRCTKTGKIKISSKEGSALDDMVSECLSNKLGPGEEPSDQDIAICFSESRKKLKGVNSQIRESKKKGKLSAEEPTEKEKKMEARLTALEDDNKEMKKENAKLKKANDELHENNHEEKLDAAEDNDETGDNPEEGKKSKKSKKGKKGNDEMTKEKKEETAKIASMSKIIDDEIKMPKIAKYLAYRASVGDTEEVLEAKKAKLLKASVEEINEKLEEVAPHMASIEFNNQADSKKPETEFPMGFPGQVSGSTTQKSGSELFTELYE